MTVDGDVRTVLLPHGHEPAPRAGPFAAALRTGEGAAATFLPHLPVAPEAWSESMAAARRAVRPLPAEVAETLAVRQRALGAGPAAEEAARALGKSGTLAIVTGQQPGLLGGLLLAFHKAAGAVHLAKRLDGGPGSRVVPVFWLASEDHDLEEANRALLLDRQGRPRRVRLDRAPDGCSLMHVPVTAAEGAAAVAEAAGLLPDTDRARAALRLVEGAGDEDFATWCARSFARLFGEAGIVVLEPTCLAPLAGDALAGLVAHAAPIRTAVQVTERALLAAGLPAPLSVEDTYLPLFVREQPSGPRRRPVLRDDGGVRIGSGDDFTSLEGLAAHVREHPELGSGDVVGRVFVQNLLLPVLAYVGGPTELAYLAQIRAAHEAVGQRFPLAVPRPEAAWMDAKIERNAAAFGLEVSDLLAAPLERPPSWDEDGTLAEALAAWRSRVLELPDALGSFEARTGEIAAALTRSTRRLEVAFDRVTKDLRAAAARDAGVGAGRWTRILDTLWPRGRPQERGLSALSIVARHGPEVFQSGLAGLDPLAPGLHILHVS